MMKVPGDNRGLWEREGLAQRKRLRGCRTSSPNSQRAAVRGEQVDTFSVTPGGQFRSLVGSEGSRPLLNIGRYS